jgi:hypothetical protein
VRMRAGASGASTLAAGAHTGFEPALLTRSAPIQWQPDATHNGVLLSAASGGMAGELRFVVPTAQVQSLYLQVVNRGQQPGWFDAVRVTLRRPTRP